MVLLATPRCLTLSSMIVAVFLATTVTLLASISRDLRQHPDLLSLWEEHLDEYLTNSTHQEELVSATRAALSTVLHSELSVFLMVQWCFAAYALAAVATIFIFLGRLTAMEATKLTERLIRYVVFKVIFCGALIMPDIYDIVLWMAWFAMIGFMRVFLGAAKDRLEALSISPTVSVLSHLRTLALALAILVFDIVGITAIVSSLDVLPMTKVLLCAFDMGIILVEGTRTLIHYGVNMWDRYIASQLENRATAGGPAGGTGGLVGRWEAWEGKGSLLMHLDLVSDVLVHLMTLTHYIHVWTLHGLSFQLIDGILFLDIRSILFAITKRIRSYMAYRNATHSLKHAFPDKQLSQQPCQHGTGGAGNADGGDQAAELCAICMERMAAAKQLPCGHHFHLPCLRAWLQQSGVESFACPLCRMPLLRPTVATSPRAASQGRRLARLGTVARNVVSRLYLDVALSLLIGIPISTSAAALRAHHQRQGVMGPAQASNPGHGSRHRPHGRRAPRPISLLEEVQESDTPSPVSVSNQGRGIRTARSPAHAQVRPSWWALPTALRGRAAQQRRVEESALAEAPRAQENRDLGTPTDIIDQMAQPRSLDARGDNLESEEEEEDSYGDLPSGLAVNDNSRLLLASRRRAWGGQEPQDGELAGPSGANFPPPALPPHPPPYMEDLQTWSAGSVHRIVQDMADSIHSSLGMGVRGGGGSVAGIQHGTDQEVDSPYRRRSRRSARGTSAAVGRREIQVALPIEKDDEPRNRACLLQNSGQGDVTGGCKKARNVSKSSLVAPDEAPPAPTAEGMPSRQRMQLRSSGGRPR